MISALPVNTSHFEAGDGPILLDNVACNESHANLSQCVHPLDIGIHDCEEDNIAGVICLSGADTKLNSDKSQSALLGSVGAALAVGAIAVVCVVFVVVVAVKRRKKNNDGISKGILNTFLLQIVNTIYSLSTFIK